VNLRLYEAAQAHAEDLASGPNAGHAGSDGSDPALRAERVGYGWTRIGENVAAGQTSAAEAVQVWMDSEPHRQNMLNEHFTETAVGFEADASSLWGTYWVMVFGTRDADEEEGGEVCNP
jgi:uncharacterized protein YkwD